MYLIFVKTNNRSWNVNLSGPFTSKEEALVCVKQLDKKLNGKLGEKVYKFSIQYIHTGPLEENIVTLD
jgi:hypothetical protein